MKCRYAAPGTYGHECGAPAETVMTMRMSEETKMHLRCVGAKIPEDGLSRAERCKAHKGVREFGDDVVREEKL